MNSFLFEKTLLKNVLKLLVLSMSDVMTLSPTYVYDNKIVYYIYLPFVH